MRGRHVQIIQQSTIQNKIKIMTSLLYTTCSLAHSTNFSSRCSGVQEMWEEEEGGEGGQERKGKDLLVKTLGQEFTYDRSLDPNYSDLNYRVQDPQSPPPTPLIPFYSLFSGKHPINLFSQRYESQDMRECLEDEEQDRQECGKTFLSTLRLDQMFRYDRPRGPSYPRPMYLEYDPRTPHHAPHIL